MSMLCECGSGKEVKGYGKFSFSHKGFDLVATRMGSECDDCSFDRKCTIKAFDEYGDDLIIKTDANLVINWDFYLEEKSERFSKVEFLSKILIALEILSVYSENNWEIASGVGNVGPSSYFFTRDEDARKYAKLKFSDTLWNWEIRHISEVIKKSDVLNK